jgi:hypothetical protein
MYPKAEQCEDVSRLLRLSILFSGSYLALESRDALASDPA